MDLDYLRTATRPEHEATEGTVSVMDASLTKQQYVATLQHIYRAIRAWDDWTIAHAPAKFAELLRGRQRSALIEADLRVLDGVVPVPAAGVEATWIPREPRDEAESDAIFLGAMYVVEGSTLGGQYIARHAEAVLCLTQGLGNAYFRGYGEETGSMWKQFKAVLAEVPEVHTELVVQSAKRMFGFFAAQMADGIQESKDCT